MNIILKGIKFSQESATIRPIQLTPPEQVDIYQILSFFSFLNRTMTKNVKDWGVSKKISSFLGLINEKISAFDKD